MKNFIVRMVGLFFLSVGAIGLEVNAPKFVQLFELGVIFIFVYLFRKEIWYQFQNKYGN